MWREQQNLQHAAYASWQQQQREADARWQQQQREALERHRQQQREAQAHWHWQQQQQRLQAKRRREEEEEAARQARKRAKREQEEHDRRLAELLQRRELEKQRQHREAEQKREAERQRQLELERMRVAEDLLRRQRELEEQRRRQAEEQRREAERQRQLEVERARRRAENRRRAAEEAYVDDGISFVDSRFKQLYDRLKRGERVDRTVMDVVKTLVFACHGETPESRAFVATMRREVKDSTYGAAVTVWKSAAAGPDGTELCSLLNRALRDDGPTDALMRPAVRLTRALNAFCVTDDSGDVNGWPANNQTYRGTVLPREHQFFYKLGKRYRVPMFLATSFDTSVATEFIERAEEAADHPNGEPVLWTFQLDPVDKCLHVNYLQTDEQEFLFAPYSAFQVVHAQWEERPTAERPHRVTLAVASDNRDLHNWPLELPLAPWA